MGKIESAFYPEFPTTRYIADKLIKELVSKQLTITFAEGCSGGSLMNGLTVPGATQALHFGVCAYSREAKERLGVLPQTIDTYGEYSCQVALEMAQAAQKFRDDSLAIATVGRLDWQNGNPPWVNLALIMKGKNPWLEKISLVSKTRRELKTEIAEVVLSRALMFVTGYENQEKAKPRILPHQVLLPEQIKVDLKAERVIKKLSELGLKLATMESCTGGAVASALTNVCGASKVFDSAWLAYDENVKNMLGVPLATMAYGGVYSEQVALAMAQAAAGNTGADIAIATTGMMDTIDRRPYHNGTPCGRVYIAIIIEGNKPILRTINLKPVTREDMKLQLVEIIFDLLFAKLNEFTIDNVSKDSYGRIIDSL
jgi:nicotinamide-nucleotide amidase